MQISHRPLWDKVTFSTRKLFLPRAPTLRDLSGVNKSQVGSITPPLPSPCFQIPFTRYFEEKMFVLIERIAKIFLYVYIFASNAVLSFIRFEPENAIASMSGRSTQGPLGELKDVGSSDFLAADT